MAHVERIEFPSGTIIYIIRQLQGVSAIFFKNDPDSCDLTTLLSSGGLILNFEEVSKLYSIRQFALFVRRYFKRELGPQKFFAVDNSGGYNFSEFTPWFNDERITVHSHCLSRAECIQFVTYLETNIQLWSMRR